MYEHEHLNCTLCTLTRSWQLSLDFIPSTIKAFWSFIWLVECYVQFISHHFFWTRSFGNFEVTFFVECSIVWWIMWSTPNQIDNDYIYGTKMNDVDYNVNEIEIYKWYHICVPIKTTHWILAQTNIFSYNQIYQCLF